MMPLRSSHHVCFSCQKAFKKPADVAQNGIVLGVHRYPCPQCKREMTPIGKNFRAPKQHDLNAWRAAEILVRAGVTFNHSGGGSMPTNPKEAMRLARDLEIKTRGAAILEGWRERT
jgi:hypothetical protein